ncbi:MAG: hypothetical protein ACOC5T_06845 [Elusimicrobiota bacterium]
MPLYVYKHPKTGEIFEVLRKMSDCKKKYKAPDNVWCERIFYNPQMVDIDKKNRTSRAGEKLEVFQADPKFVKKMGPKYVRFRDGHKEKYDPTKHC